MSSCGGDLCPGVSSALFCWLEIGSGVAAGGELDDPAGGGAPLAVGGG